MKKGYLALGMLLVLLSFGLPGVPAEAANWSEVAVTSWYNASQSSFTISTAEQLAGLAQLVNSGTNFSGKTVALASDIDLAGRE